ncbi:MAG: glycosyltransferase [Alphaproteobacteria bacterium]|nr:glycosyltransferase [Alphaproteobacteria bacterium]MDP6515838.1 glycosyltransferase [Alphaproteobacteria bacterium]
MTETIPVYVGWDPRQDIAYQVCRHSLLARASWPVTVSPLTQDHLRATGFYWRDEDPLASTAFTYTRFLVPTVAGFEDWALFCDSDFLWLGDVAELWALRDPRYAVMCVQHDYRPPETLKMDGRLQTRYPRKNWSSLMLVNCGHPANGPLTAVMANRESGRFLHRFKWLDDSLIGALPEKWNWLEGWCAKPQVGTPRAIHYTRGGPWFADWQDVDYAEDWFDEERRYRDTLPATHIA